MRYFLVSLLLGLFSTISAFSAVDAVRVVTTDGGELIFKFEKSPEISFTDNSLKITISEENPAEFDFENVSHFDFIDASASGIDATEVTIKWDARTLSLSNLDDNTVVEIYSIGGQKLLHAVSSGQFQIDRTTLGGGVYILRAGNFSVKFAI